MHSQINMQYNFIKWYTFDTDLPKSAPLHRWPFALHFPNIVYSRAAFEAEHNPW